MRRILLCLCLAVLPVHAAAQEGDVQGGLDLLQEGTRLFLRGLVDELGPQIESLKDRLGDLGNYRPPEILPNGDIIIRRKQPVEPPLSPNGEVEL